MEYQFKEESLTYTYILLTQGDYPLVPELAHGNYPNTKHKQSKPRD